jgi:hypothetical protein
VPGERPLHSDESLSTARAATSKGSDAC